MTIYKLTLRYSSFLFTNDVALVKNVEQSVDVDKLTAKDISIINAYISSGAIISDKGKIEVEDVAEVVVEAPAPVEVKEEKVEVIKEEVKVEKEIATSILDGENESKKKPTPAKKSTTTKKA
jgi:hypothetical protein